MAMLGELGEKVRRQSAEVRRPPPPLAVVSFPLPNTTVFRRGDVIKEEGACYSGVIAPLTMCGRRWQRCTARPTRRGERARP